MRIVRTFAGLLALLGLSVAMASDSQYRLAGSVISPDSAVKLALVEKPDGTQQLLREGDSIDGGTVVEITRKMVRLQFASEEIVLRLAGTENREAADVDKEYRPEDYATSGPRRVGAETLVTISRLAAAEKDDSKQRASRILGALGLPADARITAVNDQPVESESEALKSIGANVDEKDVEKEGFLFTLSIAGIEGDERVYIFADESGQIDDQAIGSN